MYGNASLLIDCCNDILTLETLVNSEYEFEQDI